MTGIAHGWRLRGPSTGLPGCGRENYWYPVYAYLRRRGYPKEAAHSVAITQVFATHKNTAQMSLMLL